jgi:hypothetical protein
MSRLVAIDPGKAGLGWASFTNEKLCSAGLIVCDNLVKTTEALVEMMGRTYPHPSTVVIEVPQVYQQRLQKGDPNDLIDVAVIAGIAAGVAAQFVEPQPVRPHKWKGNRPKALDNAYTLSLLSAEEKLVVDSCGALKSKLHNVIDAVGIGLWKLGRRK